MAKYISFNGTSDYLATSVHGGGAGYTYGEIDCLISSANNISDNTSYYLQSGSSNYQIYVKNGCIGWSASKISGVSINGTPATNGVTSFPFDQKVTVAFTNVSGGLYSIDLFDYNSGGGYFLKGNLYGLRYYYGTTAPYTLASEYDISNGSLTDLVSPTDAATLYGGTWMDDTASSSTPVNVNFDTKQTVNKSISFQQDTAQNIFLAISSMLETNQSIFSNPSGSFETNQSINGPYSRKQSTQQAVFSGFTSQFETVQKINEIISNAFATEQSIYQVGSLKSYYFDVAVAINGQENKIFDSKQSIFAPRSQNFDAEQAVFAAFNNPGDTYLVIYSDKETYFETQQSVSGNIAAIFDTEQTIFDADKSIVRRIKIDGSRQLHIAIIGSRVLRFPIKGGYSMPTRNVNIKLDAGNDAFFDVSVNDDPNLDLTTANGIFYEASRGSITILKSLGSGIEVIDKFNCTIEIDSADLHQLWGDFKHEVWCLDNQNKKTTLATGTLTIVSALSDN